MNPNPLQASGPPRGVELPFWVRGFITILGEVWNRALYRAT